MSQEQSLFERLGGAEAVDSMVADFYNRVLADAQLKPFFEHVEVDKLLAMQKEFFTAALDGPLPYTGRPLSEAHYGRGIERTHFARFVEHLLETLKTRGVSEEESSAVIGRVNTYIRDITGDAGYGG